MLPLAATVPAKGRLIRKAALTHHQITADSN
jgi:hypothetical protein